MTTIPRRAVLAGSALLSLLRTAPARAAEPVRIGQATPALSFLPLWAARAYDAFPQAGLDLTWAAIPGGDPATLAALDAGDLDLAAVGSDTALAAIAKDLPFVRLVRKVANLAVASGWGLGMAARTVSISQWAAVCSACG